MTSPFIRWPHVDVEPAVEQDDTLVAVILLISITPTKAAISIGKYRLGTAAKTTPVGCGVRDLPRLFRSGLCGFCHSLSAFRWAGMVVVPEHLADDGWLRRADSGLETDLGLFARRDGSRGDRFRCRRGNVRGPRRRPVVTDRTWSR